MWISPGFVILILIIPERTEVDSQDTVGLFQFFWLFLNNNSPSSKVVNSTGELDGPSPAIVAADTSQEYLTYSSKSVKLIAVTVVLYSS